MPTPIATLPTIDAHPIVAQAWSEQRPEDEIVAARAEAVRLEAAWLALAAVAPGTLPDDAVLEAMRPIGVILQAVYNRSPVRLIVGWYLQEMHALVAEAHRLLGPDQLVVRLHWHPL